MKIILTKDVPSLGKKFEVKNVKPGYGRNFLLPKKFAIAFSKKNSRWLEKIKAKQDEEKEKILKKLNEVLDKVKKTKLKILVKKGEKGEMFEKITEVKIAKAFKEEKIDIKKENIILKKPISKTGEHEIVIKLEEGIETKIKIKVVAEKEKKKVVKKETKKLKK